MLDSYELPFGLKINEIKEEPELMVLTSLNNYNLNDVDKKILDHVLCENFDWCVKNKTLKVKKKIKNKTKKNKTKKD